MSTTWGWKPERTQGLWRHGPLWLKPLSVAVPWVTVGLLVLMMHMVGGTMTVAEGVVFELPEAGLSEGEATQLVALVMPMPGGDGTYVFFDDARYTLGAQQSAAAFGEHLAERAGKVGRGTLLVLADRSVPCGEIARLSEVVRMSGVERMLFATKSGEARAE